MGPILQSLAFSPRIFFMEIVLFLALWIVLHYIFWKPIMAHLKWRDQVLQEKYDRHDRVQREMESLRADYLARMALVEQEARGHIQAAIREAQAERERILAEARKKAEENVRSGAAQIEAEKTELLHTLRQRMMATGVDVASAALGPSVDRHALEQVIEQKLRLPLPDSAQALPQA